MTTAETAASEVTIEKLVYGGEGLARTPEGIVLVPGALPGERVAVEIEPAKKGVRRARLIQVLAASPDRIEAPCPFFTNCGGCHHQQIPYTRQLEWKRDILAECFERIGKLKLDAPIETISAEPWEYRNRIRLHARKNGSEFRLGYLENQSQQLCPVDACAISSPGLQAAIRSLAAGELTSIFPDGAMEIELFATDEDRSLMATITARDSGPGVFGDAWMAALPKFESVCWTQQFEPIRQGARNRLVHREPPHNRVWGTGAVIMKSGEFHYRVSHHSFFQTNRRLLEKMIDAALGDARGVRALDLFAGVGFFTLPLSRRFEHVIAVESHPSASGDLQTNSGVAASQVYVYPITAESFIASKPSRQPWDLVLVDPPRHGLPPPVRDAIVAMRPRRMVYVSCDPTTLARDLAVFQQASYKITSVHLIDLFPQTYHLEAIVHMALPE